MTKEAVILVLSCLGLAQSLFLTLYLLTLQKGNRRANRFLAFLLLGLTIRIGKSVLNVYLDLGPWQRNLGLSGILMVGPFLWMYGQALFDKKKDFGLRDYLHLVPFALFVLLCTVIPNSFGFWSFAFYVGVFVHLAVYVVAAVRQLILCRETANASVFSWFRNLTLGVVLIWAFYMGNLTGIIPYYIGGAIFFSLLIYVFSFLLLKHASFPTEKYANSSMDKATSQRHLTQLKTLLEMEEIYLDSRLSLKQTAERLGIAPRELSQAINENEQRNFSEFVNSYRIQKAKQLLVDAGYAQEKIATIAYDCGFGNVTSFNLAFKSATDHTPSQYRNRYAMT
ncbi:helix-turn-helix transcriptional regulator [Flavobacteriaceae bacterium TP-CH-4]|uniref:Helix-turn-helix transcriptional regulator n=1 Tax=Pelagihabitans pacificus TaxID=2696054 RepID=A0A967EEL2_9FLAO|nr:AraC family transcriptional regulator [Pelagihabitans pacificus]NHF60483.1 helix-turn-helix transcriptional regulator [Pelagihabitans pacificus]